MGELLPTRPFGKTGEQVTIYCVGGSHVAKADSETESQAIIEKSIEMGARFFDNAWSYSRGRAEELFGKYLTPKYREHVFLMTKTKGRTAEQAQKQIDDSLRRMKTDYIDLLHMHEVRSPEDVDARLSAGILEVMLKAQQEGKVRHLGFSGHRHSSAHRRLMEKVAGKDPFVACQLPINPVDAAKPDSFTKELVPELVKRDYAVLAMKTLAHGRFFKDNRDRFVTTDPVVPDNLSLEEVFWYVLSQPVTTIVSGTDKLPQVAENIGIIKRFAKLSIDDQKTIVAKVEKFTTTPKLEYYRPAPGTYS